MGTPLIGRNIDLRSSLAWKESHVLVWHARLGRMFSDLADQAVSGPTSWRQIHLMLCTYSSLSMFNNSYQSALIKSSGRWFPDHRRGPKIGLIVRSNILMRHLFGSTSWSSLVSIIQDRTIREYRTLCSIWRMPSTLFILSTWTSSERHKIYG